MGSNCNEMAVITEIKMHKSSWLYTELNALHEVLLKRKTLIYTTYMIKYLKDRYCVTCITNSLWLQSLSTYYNASYRQGE